MKKPVVYPLTTVARAALRERTTRALNQRWEFQDLPVQVGQPCPVCGGLFWYVTGAQLFAPSGYCLNCHPAAIEKRPKLLEIVQHSMEDVIDEIGVEVAFVDEH